MDPDLEQVKETGSEQCTSLHEESNDEKHADKYEIDWKAEAQKWEAQAKANKDAIGKLEEAAKTDERKRQEKIARLEKEGIISACAGLTRFALELILNQLLQALD